jgi:succinyl-CoA synthetase beta subunit
MSYVRLDGTVGCIANGAGLAMATADVVALMGGSPANFLDVGDYVTEVQVLKALEIINSDPRIGSVLVNIFAGDIRCDDFAKWIINATESIPNCKPIFVYFQGQHVEEAKLLIQASGCNVILAADLEDAAAKAVDAAELVTRADKQEEL